MFFTKMQGAGNDYIFILPHDSGNIDRSSLARRMSDRHFGVGSDGLVFIDNCDDADFSMDFYNSDGSPAEICGNALRCVARLVYENNLISRRSVSIKTAVGIRRVEIGESSYRAEFGRAEFIWLGRKLFIGDRQLTVNYLSVGNPHAVIFSEEKDDIGEMLKKYGALVECHPLFQGKTNVEFVKPSKGEFTVRVWERGSGETLACGSGAVAVSAVAMKLGLCRDKAVIHMRGGDLEVTRQGEELYLCGSAQTVFTGNYKI